MMICNYLFMFVTVVCYCTNMNAFVFPSIRLIDTKQMASRPPFKVCVLIVLAVFN